MFQDHYVALVFAYSFGLCGWLLVARLAPTVWPPECGDRLAQPLRELGFSLVGVIGIIAMGQLWLRGIRLPESGRFGPIWASLNQLLIFSPILLILTIRRHNWASAWLPRRHFVIRLATGLVLAVLSVGAYSQLRDGVASPAILLSRIWRYENLDELVQVLLEDVSVAILFVRLAQGIGSRWATVIVSVLFAAGHISPMVSHGATWTELTALVRDAGLCIAVLLTLQRSQDVLWFWPIHFCLDLTQYARIVGP